MVFDYEAAWADLLSYVETKPQHGEKQLREQMAAILGRRRVNEAGFAQMLRLYGVQVDTELRAIPRDDEADPDPDSLRDGGAAAPDHRLTGGHHGSIDSSSAVLA